MGLRSINKYLAIFGIVRNLLTKGSIWLEESRDEESPGGEDITITEYMGLIPIIEESIMDALGLDVIVSIEPK